MRGPARPCARCGPAKRCTSGREALAGLADMVFTHLSVRTRVGPAHPRDPVSSGRAGLPRPAPSWRARAAYRPGARAPLAGRAGTDRRLPTGARRAGGRADRGAPPPADRRRSPACRESPHRRPVRSRHARRPRAHLLAGRRRPVLLRAQGRPLRRPGHHRLSSDSKRSPGHLSRQGPPALRWCAYEAGKVSAHATAPDHLCYAAVKERQDGKRAALAEARKIIRRACHILAELGDDAFTTV